MSEFYGEGTLAKLQQVLAADKSTPAILVIACHGDAATGALQVSDPVDKTVAQSIDAARLSAFLGDARDRLALTVFASSRRFRASCSCRAL